MRFLAVLFFLLCSTGALAERGKDEDRLGEVHDEWSDWVLDTANTIDTFFSNTQGNESQQKTRLRVFVRIRYDDNEGGKISPGIRAKLSLPSTENRLHLILGDDEDEARLNDLADNQQNISLQLRGKTETPLKKLDFNIGIRRRDDKYQPYGRVRHNKTFESANPWVPQLTNSVYYFTKSRLEYRGTANFNKVLGSHHFFRPSTVLRWYQNNSGQCDDGWCLDQYFSLYERLRRHKSEAIAYDAEIYLRNKPDPLIHDVVFKTRYRRMTNRKWLFWEMEPAIHFPAEYGHDATFRLTFRIEGVFGYNTEVNINQNFMPATAPWENTLRTSN